MQIFWKQGMKKLFSLILAVIMVMVSVQAYAAEVGQIEITLRVGDETKENVFINNKQLTVKAGATAYDAFKQAIVRAGVDWNPKEPGEYGVYISEIGGLAAGTEKYPNSGWLFRVNGEFAMVSADAYILQSNDTVEWLYTYDYTKYFPSDDVSDEDISVDPARQVNAAVVDLALLQTYRDAMLDKIQAKESPTDWECIALAIAGRTVPDKKIDVIRDEITANQGDYRLITDLTRTALLLQLAGYDITDFTGVNLAQKLYGRDDLGKQGGNGYAFALIVLANLPELPADAKEKPSQIRVALAALQNKDGGFAITTGASVPDATSIALQGLAARYDGTSAIIESALDYLQAAQGNDGNFMYEKTASSEATAQVIIALTGLGVNPDDGRFIKNGRTLMDVLLAYRNEDGSFAHISGGPSNQMATENALLAMEAYIRFFQDRNNAFIYQFAPIKNSQIPAGAPKDYDQISDWAKSLVMEAYAKGIVGGDDQGRFNPQKNVTRAEFMIMLLKAMGISPQGTHRDTFNDVPAGAWYAQWVEAAAEMGLIHGVGNGAFAPESAISRQDMAVILVKAFQLPDGALAVEDSGDVAAYAKEAVGAVMAAGIMNGTGYNRFSPGSYATREMAAAVLIGAVVYSQTDGE